MIKDVVILSGDPPVLTSQLDNQIDSPEIFASGTSQQKNRLEWGGDGKRFCSRIQMDSMTPRVSRF